MTLQAEKNSDTDYIVALKKRGVASACGRGVSK